LTLFVDTSVWSAAFRRDVPAPTPETGHLQDALLSGAEVCTTGLVLQELLQGFRGAKNGDLIKDRFGCLRMIVPTLDDHVAAAELRNLCRRRGVQLGTVDALLARLCLARELVMLTSDRDFHHAAEHTGLIVWRPS